MIARNSSADPFDFKEMMKIAQKECYSYVKEALALLVDYLVPDKLQYLYLSFNGGKDATIVLFLTLIILKNSKSSNHSIKCIHFSEPDAFQQINAFIQYMRKEFSLEWIQMSTKKYSQQLTKLALIKPIKYIIMGTRKDDPYCQNLGKIAPSDRHKGYPQFIRINPIFQWSYQQVWDFITGFNIPYCKLYDEGYTYLGNKTNTAKNKELFDKQAKVYSPASKGKSEIERKSRVSQLTSQFTSQ